MKKSSPIPTAIDHQEQQRLAYQLWEKANRPYGMDLDFWVRAERQLAATSQSPRSAAVHRGSPLPKSTRAVSGTAGAAKPARGKSAISTVLAKAKLCLPESTSKARKTAG